MKRILYVSLSLIVFSIIGCGANQPIESEGGKLTILPPLDTTIAQGAKENVDVLLTRKKDKMKGTVTVEFENLPEGVSIEGGKKLEIGDGEEKGTITLIASKEAKIVTKHEIKVVAYYKDKKLEETTQFALTVKKSTIESDFKKTAKAYEKNLKSQLESLDKKIKKLSQKIKEGTKATSKKAQQRLQDLKEQYKAAKVKAARVLRVTEQEWEEFQKDSKQAVNELKKGVREAYKEFED